MSAEDLADSAPDIYARLLFSLGRGHPLWHPSPSAGSYNIPQEIHIGAVGRIEEGSYRVILNTMTRDDSGYGQDIPEGFTPLHLQKKSILGPVYLQPPVSTNTGPAADLLERLQDSDK